MQMSEEIILRRIRSLLINAFPALKNEEYQKRVWLRGEGPEVDSYIDTTLNFIDGCEHIFTNDQAIDFLGEECYNLLKKLYQLVKEHVLVTEDRIGDTDLLGESDLLDDPKWQDIQVLATKVELHLSNFVKRHTNGSGD